MIAGQRLGSCTVVGPLGEGAMGLVYLARDERQQLVAVKVLRPELTTDADLVSRFFAEAQAASRLGHPHIVRTLGSGVSEDGRSFLVMERLEGERLSDRLRRVGPVEPQVAAHVGLQLASALGACHAAGIVHRDVKPSNVFVVDDAQDPWRVKLFDFGLCKLLYPEVLGSAHSRSGEVRGTPAYMSPEQARGRRAEIDHRTDIYGLGVVLYELLTGELPYRARSLSELLLLQAQGPPPRPQRLRPELPRALDEVVARALAREPRARFASMDELAQALRASLRP